MDGQHHTTSGQCLADVPAVLPERSTLPEQQHEDARDGAPAHYESGSHIDHNHHVMEAEQEVGGCVGDQIPHRVR